MQLFFAAFLSLFFGVPAVDLDIGPGPSGIQLNGNIKKAAGGSSASDDRSSGRRRGRL